MSHRFGFAGSLVTRLFACTLASSVVALVAVGCGEVTGLSNDYSFTDDGAAGDGGRVDGGDASRDGAGDGAGDVTPPPETCNGGTASSASEVLNNANGDKLPNGCSTCLAQRCCNEVNACGSSNPCDKALSCVFNCQQKTSPAEKLACVNLCPNADAINPMIACSNGYCPACGKFK